MRISDWSSDVCSSDLRDRPVDARLANAGRSLGHGFLDQDLDKARQVVNLNIIGTISLIHKVGRQMRQRGQGKILITGSIAGFIPGSFQAVYNGTKRSEEHTSELQSLMRISYAVFCLKKKKTIHHHKTHRDTYT